MSYVVIPSFVLDQLYGYQTATQLKDNIEASVARRACHDLGGSMLHGVRSAAYVNVPDSMDREIDGTKLGGFTKQARVDTMVENAATSCTPKVINVTDAGASAGTGTPSAATVQTSQTIALTLAAGVKKYRLQLTGSNATWDCFAKGYIEIYA